ncbi:hypothetical protein [Kamptonema formosum]|nr:hypothetical protein [Oscillatoria sp. PCC 10802]
MAVDSKFRTLGQARRLSYVLRGISVGTTCAMPQGPSVSPGDI